MILSRLTRGRWAGVLAIALASSTVLAACGGSSSSAGHAQGTTGGTSNTGLPSAFGNVPAAGTDSGTPGTITVAGLTAASPTWIFPIVPGANTSAYDQYQFVQEMWRPLYWEWNGVHPAEDPTLSIANEPVWSNNDQTVTLTLKSAYKWSDGQPLTSNDVLMDYYLIKAAVKESPANWGQYTANLGFPDQVTSVSAPDASTVVMNLNKPVNPMWFTQNNLSLLIPMPSHAWSKASATGPQLDFTKPANAKKIWDFFVTQAKSVSTYATSPLWKIVDGPYNLASYNATTGDYSLTPSSTYGGPHAKVVLPVKVIGFASETAAWNAVKAGAVTLGGVPSQDIPQIPSITGQYNDFGYPAFGFNYAIYNFKDTTGSFSSIIGQLYIRQVIAHLEDEKGIIRAFFHNAAGEGYGPVPAVPSTQYTPADALTNPYPFSVATAISMLKAHGWTVNPGGTDVCASAGSGPTQCGAGIPAGTKLEWNFIYDSTAKVTTELAQSLASDARQAGVTLDLQSSNFNTMVNDYNDPSSPKNNNKWAMEDFGGFSINAYPTMVGIFNTPGSLNIGGYSDPQADTLMTGSTSSPDPNAVKNEASYLTAQQPGLFQPNQDRISVWLKTLSGPVQSFESITEFQLTPELWYFTK